MVKGRRLGRGGSGARRRKRRGGWRSLTGLTWPEVKDIHQVAHRARFNTVLDIMPTEGTDAERKRHCTRVVAHLGQSLKRRGREHLGVTTFEKKTGVDVHGHHICWMEPRDKDLLAGYDGQVVSARMFPSSERSKVVGYCTKQRLPLSPEVEKNIRHRREKGLPIRGRRVSFTKAAAALLRSSSSIATASQPAAIPETALKASGQLLLFPEMEKPVARLSGFYGGILSPSAALELEYRRRRRGLSQHQFAGLIGLSQSHYANVARGHDRMSRHTARRLKDALLNDNLTRMAA